MSNEIETREQKREQEKKSSQEDKQKKRRRKKRIRLIPIWLRLILVAIFAAASLVAGLVVGYGIVGDGEPGDVLNKETWQHIVDIVTKE